MKEKKTGKFGRAIGWLVSICLIAALAGGLVASYPRMVKEAGTVYIKEIEQQKMDSAEWYLESVLPLMYGMYTDWKMQEPDSRETPGTILLGQMDTRFLEEELYLECYRNRMENLEHWYYSTYAGKLNEFQVDYYVYGDDRTKGVGTISLEEALADAAAYPLLLQITFDETGIPVVGQERGVKNCQSLVNKAHSDWLEANRLMVNYEEEPYAVHGNIQGCTVIIASTSTMFENLNGSVHITYSLLWECISAMEVDYFLFVLAALVIVLLLGLLLPTIRPLGLKEGWKAHIPLELVIMAALLVVYVLVEGMPEFIVKCQMELEYPESVFYWLGVMEDIVADGRIVYVIQGANIALWFGLFFVAYLGVINVRQLFSKGIVRFFKENTLTGKVICLVCGWIKRTVQFCGEIDFSNEGTRNFVLAVVLNFIAIALMCCTWVAGIFLAVPYSLVLFWLLQRKWKKIRTSYEVLLSTTEEMAEGVTDVEYIGNAGVFHELQTALQGVQAGFHTAVQEEVKSQKMKTELITNVSHDLKTPLTAIITYVDLLKNEELKVEERKKYVTVLEQKSARLKALIEDLFEISKATSGNIQLEKVELDLVQLIQEVQLELEEEIMQSGITFKVNLPEEKVLMQLDAQKTCRIFENLTVNILKHGLAGSRAYISMEQTEKEVCTVYKNISDAEITYNAEEIMERFTRGDASRNTEGSGLGLAIVKSFAEAQGGRVKVELDGDLFKVVVIFPKVKSVQDTMQAEVQTEAKAEDTSISVFN